jgi:CHAT domain-containing protein/tetratricopeptide (TPR) repeat protein
MKSEATIDLDKLFRDLAELADASRQKEFLAHHPELLHANVVVRLDDAVSKLVRVDLQQALSLAEAGLAIANQLENKEALAHGLRAKATALWFMGQNTSAAYLHEQATNIFEELGKSIEVGRTLSASIQPLILLGEYERALGAAERAREIFTRQADRVRLARLEINIGNVFHRQDRFLEALAHYERAYEQLLPDKDAEGIAAALHNMAVCLISLNDFRRALETYQRARAFCQGHEMPLAVVQADYNIAYLHYHRGEYNRAIEILRATREASEKLGDSYHTALSHLDLAEIYLELNLIQEAVDMAQEALRRFRQLGMGYEAAKSITFFAMALSHQKETSSALKHFSQARAAFAEEKNLVWVSLIDLYRAAVLFEKGELSESRKLSQDALEFFRSSALPAKAILCQLLLARLSLQSRALGAARSDCQTVLTQLEHLEAPVLKYQAHLLMGQIEEAAGNLRPAYDCYLDAREALEAIRGGLRGDELRIAFIKNRLEVYESLTNLCLSREPSEGGAEEALRYMEEAKSRTIRDLIFRQGQPLSSDDAGQNKLLGRIRELREELNWYHHRLELEQLSHEERSRERLEMLQTQVEKREKEFLRARQEISISEAESGRVDIPGTFTLEAIRETLRPNVTMLEYFRIRDRIVAAVITPDRLEVVPVTELERVARLIRLLHFQISKFRLGSRYVRTYEQPLLRAIQVHLRELYDEVVMPVRPLLEGQHLIVVPHDVLHYLPFHALFDGEQYLIDLFAISYAPSASIYSLCHSKSANTTGCSLILGVSDPRAPCMLEEARSVADILPEPELYLDARANETTLRERGPRSRLIHIATHGYFRQDNPMFSGIRLGGSYLNLYDFYNFELPAELVTLSGCATGLNAIAPGDELLGLVRVLLYAGAQSLLLSLWDVHDRSTREFMNIFYRCLMDHGDKAMALQRAMQEVRRDFPHPYYWAPFVIVGKVLSH